MESYVCFVCEPGQNISNPYPATLNKDQGLTDQLLRVLHQHAYQRSFGNWRNQQRIFVLSAWKETDLFTPEEKAILALTEEVTLIHQHGISDETYQQAEVFFNAETIGNIIMATIAMNGWNRIAVSTHLQFN
jgi:alkylhydroperoxidase family enzyme